MKKILFCLLMGFSGFVFADDQSLKLKYCESISEYAKNIMYKRQYGGQAIDSIKIIENNVKNQTIKEMYLSIIKDAYKSPLWNSNEKKKEAETEFANEALMICFETFKD